ncbi:MAG: SDR family oxidoreductase [Flavipsychrobacter sp.]
MKKVALITGANKGIGLETARQLGKKDMVVLIGARSLDKANKAVEELANENIEAKAVQLDVTKNEDIQNVAKTIEQEYGHLDVLVNNAGIIQGESFYGDSTQEVAVADLQDTFNTNLFGVVNTTQQLLPLIKKSEAGRIVNLSSILGSLTMHGDEKSPIYGSKPFAYNASKAALNQFTVHLAASLKDTNIKVNSAHPGWVKTDMGGEQAPMDITMGAKTSVALATLPDDGPTGKYMHLGEELPW